MSEEVSLVARSVANPVTLEIGIAPTANVPAVSVIVVPSAIAPIRTKAVPVCTFTNL